MQSNSCRFQYAVEGRGTSAVLDREPMDNLDSSRPCEWSLADPDVEIPVGQYDLLVRFLPDQYVGRGSCDTAGIEPWLGAFFTEDVAFPFDDTRILGSLLTNSEDSFGGFLEEDFLSTIEDNVSLARAGERFGFNTSGFDPDSDGRDNLAELASKAEPCVFTDPPAISLDISSPTELTEEEVVSIDVKSTLSSEQEYDVVVVATHQNVGRAPESTEIELHSYDQESVSLDANDKWGFELLSSASVPLESTWTIQFRADDPFVNKVTFSAFAYPKGDRGSPLNEEVPDGEVDVVDLVDAPNIEYRKLDDDRNPIQEEWSPLLAGEKLSFDEFDPADEDFLPTLYEVRAIGVNGDEDEAFTIGLNLDATTVSFATTSGSTSSAEVFYVSAVPTNDDYLRSLSSEIEIGLNVVANSGEVFGVGIPVAVWEPYDDKPSLEVSSDEGILGVGQGAFIEKKIRFTLIDPDAAVGESGDRPTCTIDVQPAPGTPCSGQAAWHSRACEADGPISGNAWPMVATLSNPTPESDMAPSAQSAYEACGDDATFIVTLSATELPVMPGDSEPQSVTRDGFLLSTDAVASFEQVIDATANSTSGIALSSLGDLVRYPPATR